MASVVIPNRKPLWRPNSVGIGSSLSLSGGNSKLTASVDKECNFAIQSKPFCFPRVGMGERRAQSAPKALDFWKSMFYPTLPLFVSHATSVSFLVNLACVKNFQNSSLFVWEICCQMASVWFKTQGCEEQIRNNLRNNTIQVAAQQSYATIMQIIEKLVILLAKSD